jgi:hypothetical protein
MENSDPLTLLKQAFHSDDAKTVQQLFAQFPEMRKRVNDPFPGCDGPPIIWAKSAAMVDALTNSGADLNAKNTWWAGGFGVLHCAPPEAALQALKRGAKIDVHAAARLGLFAELKEIILSHPEKVHEPGGDGQTPLHFASTCEIAHFLLDHGAKIDAIDIDHESTPAQYMVKDRQEVAAGLINRGCKTDILMAAALGLKSLVDHHLKNNPNAIRMRVTEEFFPMVGKRSGGTIYQWTLGWHVSPHQVAQNFGHQSLCEYLMDNSPLDVQLVNACWLGDSARTSALIRSHPGLTKTLLPPDVNQLAHAARNNNLDAVRLMLSAGWSPKTSASQHGATALHWAAWHGNVEMLKLILDHQPDMEARDLDFKITALGWALYASNNGWGSKNADYVQAVKTLLTAGAMIPEKVAGRVDVVRAVTSFKANS